MTSAFYDKQLKTINKSPMFSNFLTSNDNISYHEQFKPLNFDNTGNSVAKNDSNISINNLNYINNKITVPDSWSKFNDNNDNNMTYGIINDEHFTHNNMMPHFKSKGLVINDYNQKNLNKRMELFTGSSKNFIPKKEILQSHFKQNEPNNRYITGSTNKTHITRKYYIPSKYKNNNNPFEEEKVGPGLGLNPNQNVRTNLSKFEEYRPMPKDINSLRPLNNQKTTYSEPAKAGKHRINKSSLIGNVYKHLPDKFKENDINDNVPVKGFYSKPRINAVPIINDNSRLKSREIYGPMNTNYGSTNDIDQFGEAKTPFKTSFKSTSPSNFKNPIPNFNPNLKSLNILENERDSTKFNNLINHPSQNSKHVTYNATDLTKITKRDNFMNQTTNVKGKYKNQTYNQNEIANITKRDNFMNQNTNVTGKYKNQTYNPNEITNITKRDNFMNQNTNVKGKYKNQTYNPNDLINPTQRDNIMINNNIIDGHSGQHFFDPNHLANPTQRNEISNHTTNVKGSNKHITIDYKNIPATTLKELMCKQYDLGVLQGIVKKHKSFNPYDIPSTTLKEIMIINHFQGNIHVAKMNGYLSQDFKLTPTLRSILNRMEYGNINGHDQVENRHQYNNVELDPRREILNQSRNPTNRKHNVIQNKNTIGNVNLNEPLNLNRENYGFKSSNDRLDTNYNIKDEKYNNKTNLDTEILNQLKNNPYVI